MKTKALLALALVWGATGCLPEDNPPCMPQHQIGDRFTVRLGAAYDAASEYLYDRSFPSGSAESCNGLDGLTTGAVVTVTIDEEGDGASDGCTYWRARFEPELPLSGATGLDSGWPSSIEIPDKTIAISYSRPTLLAGRQTGIARTLLTPSGDPDGQLLPRELPPLAVSRDAHWDGSDTSPPGGCFDFWVATPEPVP